MKCPSGNEIGSPSFGAHRFPSLTSPSTSSTATRPKTSSSSTTSTSTSSGRSTGRSSAMRTKAPRSPHESSMQIRAGVPRLRRAMILGVVSYFLLPPIDAVAAGQPYFLGAHLLLVQLPANTKGGPTSTTAISSRRPKESIRCLLLWTRTSSTSKRLGPGTSRSSSPRDRHHRRPSHRPGPLGAADGQGPKCPYHRR